VVLSLRKWKTAKTLFGWTWCYKEENRDLEGCGYQNLKPAPNPKGEYDYHEEGGDEKDQRGEKETKTARIIETWSRSRSRRGEKKITGWGSRNLERRGYE